MPPPAGRSPLTRISPRSPARPPAGRGTEPAIAAANPRPGALKPMPASVGADLAEVLPCRPDRPDSVGPWRASFPPGGLPRCRSPRPTFAPVRSSGDAGAFDGHPGPQGRLSYAPGVRLGTSSRNSSRFRVDHLTRCRIICNQFPSPSRACRPTSHRVENRDMVHRRTPDEHEEQPRPEGHPRPGHRRRRHRQGLGHDHDVPERTAYTWARSPEVREQVRRIRRRGPRPRHRTAQPTRHRRRRRRSPAWPRKPRPRPSSSRPPAPSWPT